MTKKGYLISVNRLPALTETIVKKTAQYQNGVGISVRDLGNAAYALITIKNQETDRVATGAKIASQSLQTISENGRKIMLEQANEHVPIWKPYFYQCP